MPQSDSNREKEIVFHLRFLSFVCFLLIGFMIYGYISSHYRDDWPENFLKKANIYHDNYQFDKLKEYSIKRISSHPKDPNGYWYLGLSYQHNKYYSKAIELYKKAILLTNNIDHMETLNGNIKQCRERLNKYGEVKSAL